MILGRQVEHRFGGSWTEIKLNAVSDYLSFFTRALQAQPTATDSFETWYVDAFAGTGERAIEPPAVNLFDELPPSDQASTVVEKVRLEGSARRAIAIVPPFRHLVFVEKHIKRHAAIKALEAEFPTRDIQCIRGDANSVLRDVLTTGPWASRSRSGLQRAVVFLDPYGMSVRWDTLRFLAETRRADVWYLFPLHAALRQLAHDHAAIDEGKRIALGEIFGTPDWEDRFYKETDTTANLFNYADRATSRNADPDQVERFAAEQLRSIFSFVSEPIPILARRKLRLFSLFLLSGNKNERAIKLIQKGVAAQIKRYGRRTM